MLIVRESERKKKKKSIGFFTTVKLEKQKNNQTDVADSKTIPSESCRSTLTEMNSCINSASAHQRAFPDHPVSSNRSEAGQRSNDVIANSREQYNTLHKIHFRFFLYPLPLALAKLIWHSSSHLATNYRSLFAFTYTNLNISFLFSSLFVFMVAAVIRSPYHPRLSVYTKFGSLFEGSDPTGASS